MTNDAAMTQPVERTFRDPAGWVELHPDAVYRFVQPAAQAELLEFLSTPLAQRLAAEGRLVSTEIGAELPDHPAGEGSQAELLVLRHPRIPFISYPSEWCPAQWKAAAELTLTLNQELLAEGWILKDATPLNILFQGTRPVLVDVASVARLDPTRPIWYAYGQFVRTFLLPLLAHRLLAWPLRTAQLRRDGLEPEELFGALPLSARLQQPALSTVTLPALLGKARPQQAANASSSPDVAPGRDPETTQHVLQGTMRKLLRQVRRSVPLARHSKWAAYTGTACHYSEDDHVAKRSFVQQVLAAARPSRVLDVGANAGVYSELAADGGAAVVAVDTDPPTLDRLYTRVQSRGKNVLPLVVDLANPTPGTGWKNRENAGFLERAQGQFDGLLMLAVVHHLLLHDHIPLREVAALAATLTTRLLVVEWVPSTDVMFQQLVRGREAIFAELTETAFREEFGRFFLTVAEHRLANGRVLLHMESRSAA